MWVQISAKIYLSVEELLDELLDLGNTGGSSDQHNLVDISFGEVSIFHDFLDWLHGGSEKVHVEFLKLGSGQSFGEVLSLVERLNLDSGLMLGGQSSLGLLNFTSQLLDGPVALPDVFATLLLVQFNEVLHHTLIEIFTT